MDMSNIKHYNIEKSDIPIRYFQREFSEGYRILDKWQRCDRWILSYKMDLIISILSGNDIPKIMEYTLVGDNMKRKRILDGGHRTRCIDEYINGEFGVKIGENYYFWTLLGGEEDKEKERNTSKNKNIILSDEYKHRFMDYKLTITTYIDLTDKEARERFNELNHCNPMNNTEVINSHCSILVDTLREFWVVDDPDVCEQLNKAFVISKKDLGQLGYMIRLVSLFSLIERKGKMDVFNYCEPKGSLVYARCNETQFSNEEFEVPWSNFKDLYDYYEGWIDEMLENGFSLSNHSEALTYFDYITDKKNITKENNKKICEFYNKCIHYKKESKEYVKKLNGKKHHISQIQESQEKLKELTENVGQEVVDWLSSFGTNGAGKSNLQKRKHILTRILR